MQFLICLFFSLVLCNASSILPKPHSISSLVRRSENEDTSQTKDLSKDKLSQNELNRIKKLNEDLQQIRESSFRILCKPGESKVCCLPSHARKNIKNLPVGRGALCVECRLIWTIWLDRQYWSAKDATNKDRPDFDKLCHDRINIFCCRIFNEISPPLPPPDDAWGRGRDCAPWWLRRSGEKADYEEKEEERTKKRVVGGDGAPAPAFIPAPVFPQLPRFRPDAEPIWYWRAASYIGFAEGSAGLCFLGAQEVRVKTLRAMLRSPLLVYRSCYCCMLRSIGHAIDH